MAARRRCSPTSGSGMQIMGRGFDARGWLMKRLTEGGIPKGEIAFMSDFKKSDDKLKLFASVKAGRVRVIIGSSINMGTGVNVQKRLTDMHHLDSPWFPADLEQREGRIVRQGNQNSLVRLHAYATKGTYDTVMWQMLATKQAFIDQMLQGNKGVRSIEDVSEADQYAMATAITAGDVRAVQLAGLNADIAKYERLYPAFIDQRGGMVRRLELARDERMRLRALLPTADTEAAKVIDITGDKFTVTLDGKPVTERKVAGEALLAQFNARTGKFEDGNSDLGAISGFPIAFHGNLMKVGEKTLYESGIYLQKHTPASVVWSPDQDAVGVAMRLQTLLQQIKKEPVEIRSTLAKLETEISDLDARKSAKFEFAELLADKKKEARELEDDLSGKNKPATPESGGSGEGVSAPVLLDIGADRTKSTAFRKWFGDSKVVDSAGKPLVVYHGAFRDFDSFKSMSWASTDATHASHYAEAGSEYRDNGTGAPAVLPVYMRVGQPFDADAASDADGYTDIASLVDSAIEQAAEHGHPVARGDAEHYRKSMQSAWNRYGLDDSVVDTHHHWSMIGQEGLMMLRDMLHNMGFDGIKYTERYDYAHQAITYAAFRPEQIKSAIGNNGSFDPNNPSILKDVGQPDLEQVPWTGAPWGAYEKQTVKRVSAARRLTALVKRLDAKRIDSGLFERDVRALAAELADVVDVKATNKALSERARGPNLVREKLLAAQRRGDLPLDMVDFALWALDQNPALADSLGVSIRKPGTSTPAGQYDPTAAVMTLFKTSVFAADDTNAETAVHEILHHTERMMPPEIQEGIRKEWAAPISRRSKRRRRANGRPWKRSSRQWPATRRPKRRC